MSFIELRWLFPLAVTLHNLEEAIWLPAWSDKAGKWRHPVAPFAFRFAVAVLTALAFIVTIWSTIAGPESVGTYLLTGYALGMLLNVLLPHLMATMALRNYMPGLATAVLLNLPVTILLLHSAFREGFVSFPSFAYYGILVCLGLVGVIPVLFVMGGKLIGRNK